MVRIKNIGAFLIWLIGLLFIQQGNAQITIQTQVLPPYQSHIDAYVSRPDLMLLTLTNTSSQSHRVQLTGHISGDNGISVRLKDGVRSTRPIEIAPMQTLSINASDIAYLFDYSNLIMEGIQERDFVRGTGLPEGFYTICIQALNYDDHSIKLSPDEPMGCSMIALQNIEPPSIISPFNEQEVSSTGPQSIPITWSTPVGTPPTLEYLVRIVEVYAGQNPNEAVMNTTPIFERTVNQNMLLYGPAEPSLVPGRQYALVVQARDPMGKLAIRNQGRSEVVSFVYGEDDELKLAGTQESGSKASLSNVNTEIERSFATHKIIGEIRGALKNSEATLDAVSDVHTLKTSFGEKFTPNVSSTLIRTSENVNANLVSPTLALRADPTLGTNYSSLGVGTFKGLNSSTSQAVVSGTNNLSTVGSDIAISPGVIAAAITGGMAQVEVSKVNVSEDRYREDFPIENSKVSLFGAVSRGRSSLSPSGALNRLIATGETDDQGQFSLELTDPQYTDFSEFSQLFITVKHEDFEIIDHEIDPSVLNDDKVIDIGTLFTTAKTYRLSPSVNLMSSKDIELSDENVKLTVYRDQEDIQQNPYLKHEGNLKGSQRVSRYINGKTMVAVAQVESNLSSTSLMAPIFYSGNTFVEIEPSTKQLKRREVKLVAPEGQVSSKEVLVYSPKFNLELAAPAVSGRVVLKAGEHSIGIGNAVVKVSYNEDDVIQVGTVSFAQNINLQSSAGLQAVVGNKANVGDMVVQSSSSLTSTPASVSPIPSASGLTYVAAPMVSAHSVPVGISSNGQLDASAVNSATNWTTQASSGMDIQGTRSPSELAAGFLANNNMLTTRTDSTGKFYIGNLPLLKEGAKYRIHLTRVPASYENLEVNPKEKSMEFTSNSGKAEVLNFEVLPEMLQIAGKVVDESNKPVPNARLNFKGGSVYFQSDREGKFSTEYMSGTHTLVVNKTGYVPLEQEIIIDKNVKVLDRTQRPTQDLQILSERFNVNEALIATVGKTSVVKKSFTSSGNGPEEQEITVQEHNVGSIGPLERLRGKVKFIVRDAEDPAVLISGAEIALFDTLSTTNDKGEWTYEGLGGEVLVTVTPEESSSYVAEQYSINIEANGQLEEVYVDLSKGVKVSGKVSSSNAALAGAEITLDGRSYIHTKTDEEGNYSLFVPQGEDVLKASKVGYYTDSKAEDFLAGEDIELNFDLRDGEGRNISTLLGFEIQLDESKENPDDEEGAIWKGKFVNLTANQTLFKGSKGSELDFEKLKVTFDADGNAIPENNQVVTTVKTIRLKLFDYLPVLLEGDEYITVKRNPLNKGSIGGKLRLDGTSFLNKNLGLGFLGLKDTYVSPHADTRMVDVEVFQEDEDAGVPELTLNLVGLSDTTVASVDLYGFNFELDLENSKVSQLGFTLAGSVKTPSLGIVQSTEIIVKELSINKDFEVNKFQVAESDLPKIKVKDWEIALGSIAFDDGDFEFAGALKVDGKLSSSPLELEFSELKMAKDAIFGGTFHIPESGLDIFGVASIKGMVDKPLSFTRIGNTSEYSLTGAGEFTFQKLIAKTIKVNSFHVQTDGVFDLDIPVDIKADLGFAELKINGLNIGNPDGGKAFIEVQGEFKTDVSMLSFEAANIKFQTNSAGNVTFSVDSISASLKTPVFDSSIALSIVDDDDKKGFAGKGNLLIPKTSIEAEVGFHYYKLTQGGVDLGAEFAAGANIMISPTVSIVKLSGGFSYNTSNKDFAVRVGGAVSLTGMDRLMKLDNINLGVKSSNGGIVIDGGVDLVVVDVATLAEATVTLDLPNKHFTVNVKSSIALPKDIGRADIDGLMKVQWKNDKVFAFLGVKADLEVMKVITAQGSLVLAYNLDQTKSNSDPEIKKYFALMDDDLAVYADTDFSGIYLDVKKNLNFTPPKLDIKIASVTASYISNKHILVYANFAKNDYKVSYSTNTSASIDVAFFGMDVAGVNGSFQGSLSGAYLGSQWSLNGNIAGSFEAGVGGNWRKASCNSIDAGWFWVAAKACISGYLDVGYRNRQLTFSAGLGKK